MTSYYSTFFTKKQIGHIRELHKGNKVIESMLDALNTVYDTHQSLENLLVTTIGLEEMRKSASFDASNEASDGGEN
jgi:hypothetical protein